MSIHIMGPVWKRAKKVRGEALLVLLALADCADENGYCYPSLGHIGDMARVETTSASRIIGRLETEGFLLVSRGGGKGIRSRYRVYPEGNAPQKGTDEAEIAIQEAEYLHSNGHYKKRPKVAAKATYKPPPNVAPETMFDKQCFPNNVSDDVAYIEEPSYKQPSCLQPSVLQARDAQKIGVAFEEKPIVEGAVDSRFQHPHFLAICEACQIDTATVSFATRGKALASAAVLFKANYSAAQIVDAAAAWPYPTAPTPHQLQDQIKSLLNRKDTQNATPIPKTANERRLEQHVRQRLERRDCGPQGGADASLERLALRR